MKQTTRTYVESQIPRRLSILSIAGKLICPGFIYSGLSPYKDVSKGYVDERKLHYDLLSLKSKPLPNQVTLHYQGHKISIINIKGTIYTTIKKDVIWVPLNPGISFRLAHLVGSVYLWLFNMAADIQKVLVQRHNYLYIIDSFNDYTDYLYASLRYPFRLGVMIGGICDHCRYRRSCYDKYIEFDKEIKKARSSLQSILDSIAPSRYTVRKLIGAALKRSSEEKERTRG